MDKFIKTVQNMIRTIFGKNPCTVSCGNARMINIVGAWKGASYTGCIHKKNGRKGIEYIKTCNVGWGI